MSVAGTGSAHRPSTGGRRSTAKYGWLEVLDAQKLKALEDENRRLKKLLADSMLDVAALRSTPRGGISCMSPINVVTYIQ